ncbi:DsbA family protein [Nocardioides sp. TRM66260-LWL]|uniref:DsbA family protein n=1 Tax=Nocardioides sp. TRM66260-LWL TaxID=2874478 RepID=UPI001CC7761E|nr:thioredoxin domain-containing protein [Nocardioides sp. TRM66260-LWL]MBZ5735928.1 DsbA family protein [Nocardioides sp. TRM66260-LWL]
MASKSQPNLPNLPGGGDAARQRREAAAETVRAAQRSRARRRLLVQAVVGLVVAVVAIGVTLVVLNGGDDAGPAAASDPSAPVAGTPDQVTDSGAFVVGAAAKAGAAKPKVTVQVVEDFQCPACRAFEESGGKQLLAQYAASKDVRVEYRGIAFLDRASSTRYSTRSLNASACVMASGPTVWQRFHDELFAQQPAEGGDGLPDEQLVSLAEQAGAKDVASCITDGRYESWTAATTKAFFDQGGQGTPTIFVNGQQLPSGDPAALKAAVDAALAG